jgi:hypothetical protein
LRLGRATSRTASRVDRLRLLGNGVVPQQAEKAFRELWTRIESTRAPGSRCPKRRARRGLKEWVE